MTLVHYKAMIYHPGCAARAVGPGMLVACGARRLRHGANAGMSDLWFRSRSSRLSGAET